MYDPYGSQNDASQPQGFSPLGVAAEYYKFKYFQNPLTWSGSRGIAVPGKGFGFSPTLTSFNKYMGGVGQGFSNAGLKGAWGAAQSGFKEMRTAGTGRVFGFDSYLDDIKNIKQSIPEIEKTIRSTRAQKSSWKRTQNRILSTQETAAWRDRESWEYMHRGYKPPKYKKIGLTEEFDRTQRTINNLEGKIKIESTNLIEKRKTLGILEAQRGIRQVGKWGIRAVKGLTTIGFGMMMWDIGMAVGAPIGRALINQADAWMTRYQDRFLPEMGGRLSAAYLTAGAATERQRAVQAISKAYINGRSAYGSEAAMMHS